MATGKLYAFWKYSEFPYVNGGPVVDMNEEGRVSTENYGKGCWWKPIKILPEKEGFALHAKLHTLKLDRDNAMTELKSKFDVTLKKLLPEANK